MRADLFEIRAEGIFFTADQPVIRDGLRCTLTAYEGQVAYLLASDRINLDRQPAREKFAVQMAGPKPEDAESIDGKAWQIRCSSFMKALWTVRETLMATLAPGAPPPAEATREPDAPQLAAGMMLLDAPNVLEQAGRTIQQLGHAGQDTSQPRLLILALVSRSLKRPINIVVTGPSSAGKSHLVGLVAKIFPDDATYVLAGMSERVLAYSEADLRHRFLIIGEASALHQDGIGASLLRNLAWEGHLRYEVTEKNPAGQQVTRVVEREGPTGFITTTTGRIEGELATRVLPVYVDDTPQGTRIILKDAAWRATGAEPEQPDVEPWWAAFWWLQARGETDVVIPFAPALEKHYPDKLVRTRRDFPQLLNLIRASAILHQRQRDRDAHGRIIATLDDYDVVFDVAAPVYAALTAEGLTPVIRETVKAVKQLLDDGTEVVTVAALAEALGIDREAVRKRAHRAMSGGWLVNVQQQERGAMQLKTGAAMPTHSSGLPSPDALRQEWHPPDPPPSNDSEKKRYPDTDVPLSYSSDSTDAAAQNGRTNANVLPCPTGQPLDASVGQLDSVGQPPMSDRFLHQNAKNAGSRTVGQTGTGKHFSGVAATPRRPTNDEIVGHVEWVHGSARGCLTCKGRTWWRPAKSSDEFQCVNCHPPHFPEASLS